MIGLPNLPPEPPWLSEEQHKWQMARRRQAVRNGLKDDLFKRVPTDAEKRYYRKQWGAVPPWRCFFGMVAALGIGILLGLAL